MSHSKKTLYDSALIIGGAGFSTCFISMEGNGQNPLPVAAGMLMVACITGMVAVFLAMFVRTTLLAIAASIIISDLLFVLYFVCRVVFSEHVHEHVDEELYLLPTIFVVVTAPTVVSASIGFGRIARRFNERKSVVFRDHPG